jgi:hypothetical protein
MEARGNKSIARRRGIELKSFPFASVERVSLPTENLEFQ